MSDDVLELRARLQAARRALDHFADLMTEHVYSEIASALDTSPCDTCACCGVVLEPAPRLCDVCAPSWTEYADDGACCDHHPVDED